MRHDICLSIGNIDYSDALEHLKKVALAEIRMDLLNFSNNQFASIFKSHSNLIATYRSKGKDLSSMENMLSVAIENGCKYIDIDISTPKELIDTFGKKIREHNGKLILSYHNFNETPRLEQLDRIIEITQQYNADITKIACFANTDDDCERILSLYKDRSNLVAFCMGNLGRITRIKSLSLGALFTYASIAGKETAPGQLSYETLELLLQKGDI
jgi:3-dehydroquinate dehydratase I